MKRIYLDYAATTPVDPQVEKAMRPYFGSIFGNPGAVHYFGQQAQGTILNSREKIAKLFGLNNSQQVIFTGSATEANNLAIRGVVKSYKRQAKDKNVKPRIITSEIEHKSILKTCGDLEKEDEVEVIYAPVSKEGIVDLAKLKSSLNKNTILVSVMYVNNEIGSLQPIAEISKLISEFRKQKVENRSNKNSNFYLPDSIFPLMHTDAVQAVQFFDSNLENLGVDLMSISGHKIYSPKGIGALLISNKLQGSGFKLRPIITGGGQEFGLRGGTENVPYIAGLAKAAELIFKFKNKETKRISQLSQGFYQKLKKSLSQIEINGSLENRAPHILNIYFPHCEAKDLLIALDLQGIAVSTGAACQARISKPPYVLVMMGLPEERALSSLRFSFGRFTKKEDIGKAVMVCIKIIKNIKHE